MVNKAEENVSKFYNTVGWKTQGGITEDARRWEDLRECAKKYVAKCRMRVFNHIPVRGENILDMASGPIQYEEYIEYSKNFVKRYCVDLSSEALDKARMQIGDHGVYLHGSFLDISIDRNFFDCAVSLHTIYHMDKERQDEAVRKLVDVTKPGKQIIIVYSNPNTLVSRLARSSVFRAMRKLVNLTTNACKYNEKSEDLSLYFYPHPIEWWYRFSDIASVQILPWRSFDPKLQRLLMPNNFIGKKIFDILFNLEDRYPKFFVKNFQYPMIILTKKSENDVFPP